MTAHRASHWRRTSLDAIEGALAATLGLPVAERIAAIDAAYPFGERRYHPYKMWLVERRIVIAAITALPMPSQAEADACRVARDQVEMGLDPSEVLKLAPNRLARECSACGRRIGKPCVDIETDATLLVPHEARLSGGASGELWEGRG